MIYFKACPRCRGDMYLNDDQYGRYMECLQCGYEVDVPKASEAVEVLDTIREEVTTEAV